MGFNTWNVFRCDGYTAAAILGVADDMVRLGLLDLGYTYLNIDDCWSSQLAADGSLVPDPIAFPDGIAAVADAVHARGLKLGIYSDRGMLTCAGRPASGGKEVQHARQFASWGIDYLKYDSCWASNRHAVAFEAYGRMRDALNATGRPILFSLCGWNSWYAPEGDRLGNSWRIAPDTDEWANIYIAVRTNEGLAEARRRSTARAAACGAAACRATADPRGVPRAVCQAGRLQRPRHAGGLQSHRAGPPDPRAGAEPVAEARVDWVV